MQALLVSPQSPAGVRFVRDYPDPSPPPGEVLVQVRLAGICATDLEIARGYMNFRGVPGHEFVGSVLDAPGPLRGRRVVAEINCVEPDAAAEDADERKHAPERTVLGIQGRDGAFAERLTVPAENCHVVPDSIPDEQAVFAEPLAAACQVVRDRPLTAQDRVAVLGTGRLGILCAQVLALHKPHLDVFGRNSNTIEVCRKLGLAAYDITEAPPGAAYDVVVECTGSSDGLRLALRFVRPRGTIVLKSTVAEPAAVDLSPIVINEVRVCGNRCGPFEEALRLLEQRAVQVERLITGRYPLSRGEEAFAAAAEPDQIKVLLEPQAN